MVAAEEPTIGVWQIMDDEELNMLGPARGIVGGVFISVLIWALAYALFNL